VHQWAWIAYLSICDAYILRESSEQAHLTPRWRGPWQQTWTLSATSEWQKLSRSFSSRAGTVTAALYHSLRTEIKRTTGQVTTVCGPGVQQKAGQINAYLTSSETVIKRTAPSQITRVSADRENNNIIQEKKDSPLSGEIGAKYNVHKSSSPVDLKEESVITLCSLREQQNYNSQIVVCQTLYTGRATETLQKKTCLCSLLYPQRTAKTQKCNHTPVLSVRRERDKAMGEWVADWIKSQTFSALVQNPVWVPPWFTYTSLSWKKNVTDRSTRARAPVQSSLGLEGEISQFVTNRSLGATYGKRNWWVTLICAKVNIGLPKTNGLIVAYVAHWKHGFLFQNVAFKFRSIMTELGGCHIVNILVLIVFY